MAFSCSSLPSTLLQVEDEYNAALKAGMQEDWEDLDALEFLSTDLLDKHGRPVVVVTAKNFPAKVVKLDRLQRWGSARQRVHMRHHRAPARAARARTCKAGAHSFYLVTGTQERGCTSSAGPAGAPIMQ